MNAERGTMNRGRVDYDLSARTKSFALRVIRVFGALPRTPVGQVIGHQLLRSGTSAGAQYREGRRARSDAEFISKLESSLQELDESAYWMELLVDADVVSAARMKELRAEADQLIAIFVSSVRTVKQRRKLK